MSLERNPYPDIIDVHAPSSDFKRQLIESGTKINDQKRPGLLKPVRKAAIRNLEDSFVIAIYGFMKNKRADEFDPNRIRTIIQRSASTPDRSFHVRDIGSEIGKIGSERLLELMIKKFPFPILFMESKFQNWSIKYLMQNLNRLPIKLFLTEVMVELTFDYRVGQVQTECTRFWDLFSTNQKYKIFYKIKGLPFLDITLMTHVSRLDYYSKKYEDSRFQLRPFGLKLIEIYILFAIINKPKTKIRTNLFEPKLFGVLRKYSGLP